jgi:thiol-disulfide isomerase/thioredoxin
MAITHGLELALGGVLAVAAGSKLMRPTAAAEALLQFGLPPWRATVAGLAVVEAALAAGLLAGRTPAAYGAAGLFAAFALAVAASLRAGHGGAPCPCFGARSRLGAATLRRALALAAAAAAAPSASRSPVAGAIALGATAVLAGDVVAAMRTRMAAPRAVGALEIPSEGPPLGSRPEILDAAAPLGLAVFLAEGCPPCDAVAGAVAALAANAVVVVRTFDEVGDADVWRALDVPGAPYAVAFDQAGAVRAKGTFNSGAQLESILATAERRAGARPTSRRSFLAHVAASIAGVVGAGTVLAALTPAEAEAYHFCGHTYTTASCPHPTGLPRVDRYNRPLRARDGRPVDDLGRLVDPSGRPVDELGRLLLDPDGLPLPPAPRSQLCLELVPARHGMRTYIDGSWHRCCGGHVRKLMDCCSTRTQRINGDRALTGYCAKGRRVFCVFYYQTEIPC